MRALVALALLLAALAVAACGGGDDSLKAEPASIGKDSDGDEHDPDEIAAAPDGRLWVNLDDGIAAVDPDERKLATQPQAIPGRPLLYDLAAGDAGVWGVVSNEDDSISLVPADPKTGRLGDPVSVELDSSFLEAGDGFEIAVGAGRVWAGRESSNLMVMLDPATGEQRGVNPDDIEDIAAGGGYGWVVGETPEDAETSASQASLSRIDPATGQVDVQELDAEPLAVAYGAGAVWVHFGDEVRRYAPEDAKEVSIDLEEVKDFEPNVGDIAVAGNTVWVTGFSEKRAVAIDAKTNKVKKVVNLPTDEPRDLTALEDSAWITVNDEPPLRVGPG